MALRKTLTIAGSDTSGGAGIQADLKTFQEHGTYGMTALTTIVAMDPTNWQHKVFPMDVNTVRTQLQTALSVGIDAMKTGMLPTVEIIELVGRSIKESGNGHIVIDPVMVCKGENEVLLPENTVAMREHLLPVASIVTPNLFEAGQLADMGILRSIDDMKEAAKRIHDLGAKHVVIKGGSDLQTEKATDLYYDGETFELLEADKVEASYNHGAGCTFAAAITANLANGKSMKEAVRDAKVFVTAAIEHGWKLNDFVGPVLHGAYNQA